VASGPQNHPSASTAHSWFRDNGTGGVAEEEAEVALMMVLPLRVLFPRDDDERENNDIADDGKKLFIVVVVVGDIILSFLLCVCTIRAAFEKANLRRFARGCRSEVRFR